MSEKREYGMTAQQQLVELNEMLSLLQGMPHSPLDASSWARDATHFIRDHGPALVELIEAAGRIELGCSFPDNDVEKTIRDILRPILMKLGAMK